MKKYFGYAALILCAALVSCKNNEQTEPEPQPKPEPQPELQLAIVKLSPEMKTFVFVSPIVDSAYCDAKSYVTTLIYGEKLVLNNPTETDKKLAAFAQSKLNIVGTSPYLLLDNGYAIIDWKWGQFHPLSGEFRRPMFYDSNTLMAYSTNRNYNNGQITNEEYYLLNTAWDDLTDLTATWEMKEGTNIDMPEIRYINCAKIEEYGQYEKSLKDILRQYNVTDLQGLYTLYSENQDKGNAFIEECNAIQALYVKTLNQMINNKDFEIWTLLRK